MYFYSWTIEDKTGELLMVGAVADNEDAAREKIAKRIEEEYEYLCFDMRKELSPYEAVMPVNDLVIIIPDDYFVGDQLDDQDDDDD